MTLLEVMIVIFIIGIIGSVVGYNMRGSLDNGRAFKTKEGTHKLYEIVQLESDGLKDVESDGLKDDRQLHDKIKQLLKGSHLVRNVDELMKDGWGEDYQIKVDKGDVRFYSKRYEDYCSKKSKSPEYPWVTEKQDSP